MAGQNFTVTQEFLRQKYTYDENTGKFSSKQGYKTGWIKDGKYLCTTIKNKKYKVHRLIWMFIHGRWPDQMIDHINGNKQDNRLENLREVNAQENAQNKSYTWGQSGFRGVVPTTKNRWKAQIGYNKKTIHLGIYETKEEAYEIYSKIAQALFTHTDTKK